ncbi:MAG: zinc ribbon domain-containing protein, partial [Thermoplasmata archaeon]|nr:zinc ribbon domain-containing protein [Thermoplasmata archaeon]
MMIRGNGMAEKYLKCPNCGAGNPEGKMFCGDCGAALPQPPPVQPTQRTPAQYASIPQRPGWLESNWKGLVGVIVVLVILAGGLGMVYSQPWSKIKVIVSHSEYSSIGVVVLIDGISKGLIAVSPGESIVGVWSVNAGTHVVQIDRGQWGVYVITHWFSPDEYVNYYEPPDGTLDF